MQYLPNELIAKIQDDLPVMALFAVSTVCAQWRRVAKRFYAKRHMNAHAVLISSNFMCMDVTNNVLIPRRPAIDKYVIDCNCAFNSGVFNVIVTITTSSRRTPDAYVGDSYTSTNTVTMRVSYCVFRGLLHRHIGCVYSGNLACTSPTPSAFMGSAVITWPAIIVDEICGVFNTKYQAPIRDAGARTVL